MKANERGHHLVVEWNSKLNQLVGGLVAIFDIYWVYVIIPIDSYFSEGFKQPPTSQLLGLLNQLLTLMEAPQFHIIPYNSI